jgi:dihydroxyacetone kinase-like protein
MIAALEEVSRVIMEHETVLNRLDNAIGDGDHGTNMARASRMMLKLLPELGETKEDMGAVLHQVGMSCISEIGGSAGPLFGTFYLRAGMSARGKTSMEAADWVAGFEAGATGVSQLGMSTEGEKTMLDALFPASRAMQEALKAGKSFREVLAAGAQAAREGVEYTKTIQASKGRAAYIGERSLGHQDPGATTIMLIIESIHKAAVEKNAE